MTTGELIRYHRKRIGLTQKQLGERAGIAEPTIRRYELGKLKPKYETIEKIAHALCVVPSNLIDITENPDTMALWFGKDPKISPDYRYNERLLDHTRTEEKILYGLKLLNDEGKELVLNRVQELTEIPEYKKIDKLPLEIIQATEDKK